MQRRNESSYPVSLHEVFQVSPRLSLCIATLNRGRYIAETLDSIVCQLTPEVELVIVDGASSDDTPTIVAGYTARYPNVKYFREETNSGVDGDYDKAVGYAAGAYCWLMTDDDIVCPGAIAHVLSLLTGAHDLVVVNSEIWNADLSIDLHTKMLPWVTDRVYGPGDSERLFTELSTCLSYIGSVVIRRSAWLERARTPYYGTAFIHVGVIFQHPPIERAVASVRSCIVNRYGNGQWTPRSFEIWYFNWPRLIWGFQDFTESAKAAVVPAEPWRQFRRLLKSRAIGDYSNAQFRKFLAARTTGWQFVQTWGVSVFPATVANFLWIVYYSTIQRTALFTLFDLIRSRNASWPGRMVARALRIRVE